MKRRFLLYLRRQTYYLEDTLTRKQQSLRTKDREVALRLLHAKNEAEQQPAVNIQIARAYLAASDPQIATRSWQFVMDEMEKLKQGPTKERWHRAMKDKAFDVIRGLPVLETRPEHFLRVLESGGVSTNVFLRRLHNFALDMTWLPWPVIVKRQWPKVIFRDKRAITWEEHQAIVAREQNPERKAFYQLAWHLGASQSDLAFLAAEDIDWDNQALSFARKKTGSIAVLRFSDEVAEILRPLPSSGALFPYLRTVRASDRATEFKQRCDRLGIKGVTLHSYRYAWAERAKQCGYPERFAQEALGHNSKAVHRAYARKAKMELPPLEEYERARGRFQIFEGFFVCRLGKAIGLRCMKEAEEFCIRCVQNRRVCFVSWKCAKQAPEYCLCVIFGFGVVRMIAMDFGRKFPLGRVVITSRAALRLPSDDVIAGLRRHVRGDWGDLDTHDWQVNQESLQHHSRLISVYQASNGIKFYIITESDRRTILLPEDY